MSPAFILYVSDQQTAARFYSQVLALAPSLDVPGMTEFTLGPGVVLGLMPAAGIRRLLGEKLRDPEDAKGVPRAELYLVVDDPEAYHRRALEAGATEFSPFQTRDWGDDAAYCADPDGYVLAFARRALETPSR